MGGGDLNMKKSWHTGTMQNQERVWKAEERAKREKQQIEQLLKEKAEERMKEELHQTAVDAGFKDKGTKLDWMYQGTLHDKEEYLLGKPIDRNITAEKDKEPDPFTMGGQPGATFTAGGAANSSRDLARKVRADPMFAIKKREQEVVRELKDNPVRMRQLKELLEAKKSKDRPDPAKAAPSSPPARRRSRSRSRSPPARRRSPSRSRSPPARRRRSPSRSRSPPARRRSRSRSPARHRSRSPPARRRSRSRSPARRRSPSPAAAASRRSRSPARRRSPSPRRRSPSPAAAAAARHRSPSPAGGSASRGAGAADSRGRGRGRRGAGAVQETDEERAAKLAAMMADADEFSKDRARRVEKHRREAEAEEQSKDTEPRGAAFLNKALKDSYGTAASGSVEERIRRSAHYLQRSATGDATTFMKR